jgi:hypothetical protein
MLASSPAIDPCNEDYHRQGSSDYGGRNPVTEYIEIIHNGLEGLKDSIASPHEYDNWTEEQ